MHHKFLDIKRADHDPGVQTSEFDQPRSERPSCHAGALSFFYRMVRRVVEILCVHHMGAVAKDAEILVLRACPSASWSRADLVRRCLTL